MRKLIIGAFTFVCVAAGVSACGSNDGNRNKADGKTPALQTPADLSQKASLTTTTAPVAVGTQPDSLDSAKPVRYTLVLGDGRGGFRFNARTLSDDAKAKIDEMFGEGKVDLKDARFEIEGHTDNLGSKEVNERVGLERAEAVRQYLCEKYEIPMESISVVSYGHEKPVGDNATVEGRAQNRRVVIKVVD
jgi:outer membrane protein OmpA-like peptidoglycan-associated protein